MPSNRPTQGERLAVVESQVEKMGRDMDALFEGQRKISQAVTRIDEHLQNGIGARIAHVVADHIREDREERESRHRRVIALWGTLLIGAQVLVAIVIGML